MDTGANRAAASQISGIKVAVPAMAGRIIDRAIQVLDAAGLSQDFPLTHMYADSQILRIADGPGEVHVRALARTEVRRQSAARDAGPPVGVPRLESVPTP